MFKITNLTQNTVGPFGINQQASIGAGASYSVDDSVVEDFADDQNLIAAIQGAQVSIDPGLVSYKGPLALGYLDAVKPNRIRMVNQTNLDYRDIVAVNRMPAGYTIYPTGSGDDIQNKVYGGGNDGVLTKDTPSVIFQFLNHFYAIGGRAIWENCSVLDKLDAWLVAPASSGFVANGGGTGAYNKLPVGGGINMLIPAAGNGAWDCDLTAKIGATSVLKGTPVPSSGNNGFFDYDSTNNILTLNAQQKGGYNLFDVDLPLFKFANKIWGKNQNGGESIFEASDVVGKLLYNTWQIKFTFTPDAANTTGKVGVILTCAAKINQ